MFRFAMFLQLLFAGESEEDRLIGSELADVENGRLIEKDLAAEAVDGHARGDQNLSFIVPGDGQSVHYSPHVKPQIMEQSGGAMILLLSDEIALIQKLSAK